MKKQILSSAILAALLLGTVVSCGDAATADTPVDTAPAQTEAVTEEVTPEAVYPFEAEDLGGYTLRILNSDELWDMFMKVDTNETNGEILNDAVYARNRKVEDKLNSRFSVELVDIAAQANDVSYMTKIIREVVLSGDDLYDVIFSSVCTTPAMVTDGYFYNLRNVEGLHLDQPWWDRNVIDHCTINDCLFFASSPMHFMVFDGAWCLYFNESMMARNDLEYPYQLVRDGKWTHAKLLEYCKAVTNLNSDSSFKRDMNGHSVYGISSHYNSSDKFILGSNEYFTGRDSNGMPIFIADNTRFYETLESLAEILDNANGYTIYGSNTDFDAENGGYMYIFQAGRALFLTAEVKAAQELRNMEETFGILPYPKLDEAQDGYYSSFVNQCLFYTIPVTNTHLHETAIISDMLSWQSYTDVLPIYYSTVVEQKGLRNDDSIEMLNLIRNTATTDLSVLFGWTSSLIDSIRAELFKGNGAFSSKIEKQKKTIEKNITKTIDAITASQNN